ncbi:MAG: FTR1 family protein [Planctomycetes bacterium]|nr:FTR1 family protein [Planctomycetota bacterium]
MGTAEFLVTFRETLEAALIIGILYTFLLKSERMDLAPRLWSGVAVALVGSTLAAILFQLLAGGLSGRMEKIFEGSVMFLAAVVLCVGAVLLVSIGLCCELVMRNHFYVLDRRPWRIERRVNLETPPIPTQVPTGQTTTPTGH